MRSAALLLLAALLPATAFAQATRPAAGVTQTERNAVELKHGMTPEDVQQLLGKPRRTALRSSGGSAIAPWQGTLQWTYVWNGGASAYSSSERTLNIEFDGTTAQHWKVNGWSWSNY